VLHCADPSRGVVCEKPLNNASQIVRFADFEVDLRGRELRKNGARIPLQEQPLQVLAVLLEHAGEVVTAKSFASIYGLPILSLISITA